MRIPSSDLWNLIRGLSSSEQRYCKIALDRGSVPEPFMVLWEIGIGQDPESEEELALTEGRGGFHSRMKLSKAKSGLYEFLLNTLLTYSASTMPQQEAYSLLNQCQLLFDRGLERACLGRLAKVEHLMGKYAMEELLLPVIRLKLKALFQVGTLKEFELFVEEQAGQYSDSLARLNERLDLLGLVPGWYLRLRKAVIGKLPITPEMLEIFPLGSDTEGGQHLQSFDAKANYYSFLGFAFSLLNRKDEALSLRLKLHQLYLENEDYRFQQILSYAGNLHNIVVSLLLTGQYAKAETYLSLQESIPEEYAKYPKKNFLRRVSIQAFSSRLIACLQQGKMDEGRQYLEGYDFGDTADIQANLHDLMEVNRYHASLIYFYFGETKKAAETLNGYFSGLNAESRKDLQAGVRALETAVHWLAGNWDYLEYQTEKALRQICPDGFEYLFVKTLQHCLAEPQRASHYLGELAIQEFPKPLDPLFGRIWKEKLLTR